MRALFGMYVRSPAAETFRLDDLTVATSRA
jgi:hypothetical protein